MVFQLLVDRNHPLFSFTAAGSPRMQRSPVRSNLDHSSRLYGALRCHNKRTPPAAEIQTTGISLPTSSKSRAMQKSHKSARDQSRASNRLPRKPLDFDSAPKPLLHMPKQSSVLARWVPKSSAVCGRETGSHTMDQPLLRASATSKKKTCDLLPSLFKTALVPASPEGLPALCVSRAAGGSLLRTFGQKAERFQKHNITNWKRHCVSILRASLSFRIRNTCHCELKSNHRTLNTRASCILL